MYATKEGGGFALTFSLSVLVFAISVALGMFAAYRLSDTLYESLEEYVCVALGQKSGFKEVLSNALKTDFRYTLITLVSAVSVYSSFLPLLLTGFKGFSSGLAVAVASRAIRSAGAVAVFSAAVFFSCVLTVPIYILMFMMCTRFARRTRRSAEPFKVKIKDYTEFSAAVMLLFAALCITDCLQAVTEPLLCSLIK